MRLFKGPLNSLVRISVLIPIILTEAFHGSLKFLGSNLCPDIYYFTEVFHAQVAVVWIREGIRN
jgi:hypothetical protein